MLASVPGERSSISVATQLTPQEAAWQAGMLAAPVDIVLDTVMNETCENAKEYLVGLVKGLGFDLVVSAEWNDEGCLLNLEGEDEHFALAENGELLDSLEVLLFQVHGRKLDREHRFVVDAGGFRRTRKAELHAMARFAADQVRKNGRPFTFGVLNSTERRIIHMSLQKEEDLFTESVGDGRDRRLQVRLH